MNLSSMPRTVQKPPQDASRRPTALPVVADAIPTELKAFPHFVVWRYVWRADKTKWDKPPLNARTGLNANSTKPATWVSFDEALQAYQKCGYDGIGYAPHKTGEAADPFVFFDLDGCRDAETGDMAEWASAIVTAIDTYTELSPSGTGLRLIARGRLPATGNRRGTFEVYEATHYLTLTGQHVAGTPTTVEERQVAISQIHSAVFPDQVTKPAQPVVNVSPANRNPLPDDEELLRRAREAKNGDKFAALWAGDSSGYTSASEADQALCSRMAFWAGPDPARIDRLFRLSGLYRKKWDRKDYRDRTIRKALEGRTDYFHGVHMSAKPTCGPNTVKQKPKLVLRTYDPTMESKTVEYLVPGMLAKGSSTVIYGYRDSNKSTLAQRIAVALTNKGRRVALMSAEENWQDGLLPKLRAMGTNFANLDVLDGTLEVNGQERLLSLDDYALDALKDRGPDLVILDPLASILPDDLNTHQNAAVRRLLFKIKHWSEKYNIGTLSIGHVNKDAAQNIRDRQSGGAAFTDAPRFVLLMLRDPDDPKSGLRYLAPVKVNFLADDQKETTIWQVRPIPALNKDGSQLTDEDGDVVTVPTLDPVGACDETAETLTAPDRGQKREQEAARELKGREAAKNFLRIALADGPRPTAEIQFYAKAALIGERTLDSARSELGVKSTRIKNQWQLSLP